MIKRDADTPDSRTVKPRGTVIKKLRLERGMQKNELAKLVDCNPTTITRIEGSRRTFPYLMRRVASVFETTLESVAYLPKATKQKSSAVAEHKLKDQVATEIGIRGRSIKTLDQTDELAALIKKLAALIGIKAELAVLFVKDGGSVHIWCAIAPENVPSLAALFASGGLKQLNVSQVSFYDSDPEIMMRTEAGRIQEGIDAWRKRITGSDAVPKRSPMTSEFDLNRSISKLTPHEREQMELLLKGFTRAEIADSFRVSRHTVDGTVKVLFRKMDVSNTKELRSRMGRSIPNDPQDVTVR